MEFKLLETAEGRKTEIKVSRKQYPIYENLIQGYIYLHGGNKTKQNQRYVYFIINKDLMNNK